MGGHYQVRAAADVCRGKEVGEGEGALGLGARRLGLGARTGVELRAPARHHSTRLTFVCLGAAGRETNLRKNPNGPAARKPGDMLKDVKPK